MYKRILVPLDGSELAEEVLPHVTALAGCTGASIILLRVPAEPAYDYFITDPEIATQVRQSTKAQAVEYLDRVSAELRSAGLKVSTEVCWGGPVHETVIEVARDYGADLIAMSTHGRSGLARLVIGSVADQVVRHSPVPVLLVRPQARRTPAKEQGESSRDRTAVG